MVMGGNVPSLVFNTRVIELVLNWECPKYTSFLALVSHLGSSPRSPYRGLLGQKWCNPRCDSLLDNFGTVHLKNYDLAYLRSCPFTGCCIYDTLT